MSDRKLAVIFIVLLLTGGFTGASIQSVWDTHKLKQLITVLKDRGCI